MEKKGTIYCPTGYRLAFEPKRDNKIIKVVFYISQRIATGI
jgi:hypothetical protein